MADIAHVGSKRLRIQNVSVKSSENKLTAMNPVYVTADYLLLKLINGMVTNIIRKYVIDRKEINLVINIKKLDNKAITPTRGSEYAAGFDLYARTKIGEQKIPAGKTEKIGTGICVEIPEGYFGAIFARSGLATKRGLRPANCVGVVDSDYRGEVIVALHNDTDSDENVCEGDRIAQLIIMPYLSVELNEVSEISGTERGDGGFGSTGTN